MKQHWVQTWGQAHAALSYFYYPSCPKTFRLVIHSAISGEALRLRLSNRCGREAVVIGNVTASLCTAEGNFLGEAAVQVPFSGAVGCTLQPGEERCSDVVTLAVPAGAYLCISVFVKSGNLRSGNLIDNADLLTIKGDVTQAPSVTNQPRVRDTVRKVAGKLLGMFLHKPIPLFSSVELCNTEQASAIVIFGDSISQQGFWTNAFDAAVRSAYPNRYAVVNQSIMGNRILRDYSKRFPCRGLFGDSGQSRLERDVLACPNVSHVVFALGTNDFLQYGTIAAPKKERPEIDAVCAAVAAMTKTLQAHQIRVIMMTVLPFGGCVDANPEKDALLLQFNSWLRENRELFDGFYDQAALFQDPEKPNCTQLICLGKDKLHPSATGGKLIAEHLNLEMFQAAQAIAE